MTSGPQGRNNIWTPAEDEKLQTAIKEQALTGRVRDKWVEIAKDFPGRNHHACRNRWYGFLHPRKDSFRERRRERISEALAAASAVTKQGTPRKQPHGGRWKNRRAEVLQRCAERNIDASVMTERWWRDNITDTNSKLDAKCRECGERVRSTDVGKFMYLNRLGCRCNKPRPWSERREEMLKFLEERNIDGSRMTREWWKENVNNETACLDATCRKCGTRVTTDKIETIVRFPHRFACACKRVDKATDRRDEVLQMCDELHIDGSRMTEEWWRENMSTTRAYLDATCKRCGDRVLTTSLAKFFARKRLGCRCNKIISWAERRAELIERCEEFNVDASVMDEDWWKKNVKNARAKIDVSCRKCGLRNATISLYYFMKREDPAKHLCNMCKCPSSN